MLSGNETSKVSYYALRMAMKAFIGDVYVESNSCEKDDIRQAIQSARADYWSLEVSQG